MVLQLQTYGQGQVGADIDGEASFDESGRSISLSSDGSIVAIGAPFNDGNGSSSGHVRVYQFNGTAWVQLGADIDGEASIDLAGQSVSLSSDGSIVAVGLMRNDGGGSSAGSVEVYKYNGTAWIQLGADIDGEAAGDFSGRSVSLNSNGSIVAIGADRNTGNGSLAGHVRVYQLNGTNWVQLGGYIDGASAGDQLGYSVSLSGDGFTVAAGGPFSDVNGSDSGIASVYKYNGVAWVQVGSSLPGEALSDQSGFSVSLSSDGSVVAVGASENDGNGSNSGHVRVYEDNGTNWVQLGADIDGEASSDRSGQSVDLNSDGSIIVIGARLNDGNGSSSGHARVYQYNGTNWTQLGMDVDGETTFDQFGEVVSLSSDGTAIAVGSCKSL